MPGKDPHPLIAILGEFDASEWAGVPIFQRGAGADVTPGSSVGYFPDPVAFLNSYGSQAGRSLPEDIASAWTGGGTATMGIDENDKVYIESSTTDFTIGASAANLPLGFDSGGHGLVGVGPPYRRTATREWQRGVCLYTASSRLSIDPAGAGAAFDLPSFVGNVQSVPVHMRAVDRADVDGAWAADCLETWDNDENDPTDRAIRWGINNAGKVYCTRPTGTSDPITWLSTTFAYRLGFTKNETEVNVDGRSTLTATYMCPGCYFPSRSIETIERITRETTGTQQLTSGAVSSNHVATLSGWRIVFWVDGPADETDSHRLWIERCVQEFWHLGTGVTLYQHWGDTRRGLAAWKVRGSQKAYDLLYTTEYNGYRGRLLTWISPEGVTERTTAWEQGLRTRFPVEMILLDDGTR